MTKRNSSLPTWYQDVSMPRFPKLTASSETDVVIIGGGLTGVLSAYLLAKKGKRVVLLEKRTMGSGATGYTTGFLTQSIDTNLADLLWMLGQEKAKLVTNSHGEGVRLLEQIVKDERIDCEFVRCDNVVFAEAGKENDAGALAGELKAAVILGLEASIEPADRLPFPNVGSLRVMNQAKYHPLKFLAGLAIAAQKAGAVLYENTEASSIETSPTGVTVHVGALCIKAAWVFSASYQPFAQPVGLYLKKAMYVSYVLELKVPKGSLPEATYEDTDNPYHYFRTDSLDTHDRIIVGGEDHRLDVPLSRDKNFALLERYVEKTFPVLSYDIVTRWRGHVLEPIDGLAFIGPYKDKRTWYAFGFSGNGMTYAPIAATMFCDAVIGAHNPWREIYDVERIPGSKSLWIKGRDFSGEFVHGVLENMFADSLKSKLKQR